MKSLSDLQIRLIPMSNTTTVPTVYSSLSGVRGNLFWIMSIHADVQAEMEPRAVIEIERNLNISEAILRHIVIRLDE